MPYAEFQDWQLYYMLEPWGWHDREERPAAIIRMLYNTNVYKKSKMKKAAEFVRDMPKEIIKAWQQMRAEEKQIERFEGMTRAEKRRYSAGFFGSNVRIVEDGDSSDDSG